MPSLVLCVRDRKCQQNRQWEDCCNAFDDSQSMAQVCSLGSSQVSETLRHWWAVKQYFFYRIITQLISSTAPKKILNRRLQDIGPPSQFLGKICFFLFLWCLTAHQHKKAISARYRSICERFDKIIQLRGRVSEVYKISANVKTIDDSLMITRYIKMVQT